MVKKIKQEHVFIVLIVCIIMLTVKALTVGGKYDREMADLKEEIFGAKENNNFVDNMHYKLEKHNRAIAYQIEELAQEHEAIQKELKDIEKKLESHRHTWTGNIVYK